MSNTSTDSFPVFWRKNTLLFLFILLYLIGSAYLIESLADLYANRQVTEEKAYIRSQLLAGKSELEAALFRDTYLADSLATVITLNPGTATENWTSIAERLIRKASFARNVGIAPNNVISHVYPTKGNEKAIGFDFRTRPEQLKTVLAAKERQDVYIAGPVSLVQGGTGLIARFPIFEDYPDNNRYWGGVSVVIDYDKLMAHANLYNITGADIALKGKNSLGAEGDIISGDPALFDRPDETFGIKLPSGSWLLAVNYDLSEIPAINQARNLIRYTGTAIAVLLLMSFIMLIKALSVARKTALQDELTGLPNRRHLMNRLNELMTQHHHSARFALVNVDLNQFKAINDTYGHDAGDKVLTTVATTLTQCLRSSDFVARIGGDEFIILLNRVSDSDQVESILAKIRRAMTLTRVVWHSRSLTPSVSLGYALFHGQDCSIKELMAEADKNMYADKRHSKVVAFKHG